MPFFFIVSTDCDLWDVQRQLIEHVNSWRHLHFQNVSWLTMIVEFTILILVCECVSGTCAAASYLQLLPICDCMTNRIFLDDLSMKLVSSSLQINFQSTRTEEWFLINSFIYLLCICRNLMKLENHFWTIQIDQMRTIGLLCSNYPTKSSQECSSHDLCSALGLRYDPMLLVLMTDSYLWVDEKAIYVSVLCERSNDAS